MTREELVLTSAQSDVPDINAGDTIYRQAAIDAADRADYTGLAIEDVKKVTDEVVKELKQLPSAQPKEILNLSTCLEYLRKNGWKVDGKTLSNNHGKWLICTDGYYPYCSKCKKEPKSGEMTDFCPSCGADMRTKEADCDYERAVEQLEHDMLYEPTFNPDDGSM